MAGSKQSKRVSWPTDVNLCQVRLFLSEDAPSQAGLGAQDHLQAKAAWLLHAAGLADSDDSLPPGFESPKKYNPKIEVSKIPLIKWQCPSRLVLNPEWLVVAGEESIQVSSENQRQSGVLEAIYPRSSSIPPNPFVAPDVQAACIDDSGTPLIPITAIEDEDGTEQLDMMMPQNHDTLIQPNHAPIHLHNLLNSEALHKSIPDLAFNSEKLQSQSNAVSSTPNLPRPEQPPSASVMPIFLSALSAEPDVLAAASAAFTAIIKSSEEGSLIDRDLLIKILTDPLMVGKLVSEYSAPKQTPPPPPPPPPPSQPLPQPSQPQPSQPPPQPSRPPPQVSFSGPLSASPACHIFQVQNHVPSLALNHHHPVAHMPVVNPVRAPTPPVKDANYYKSLIQLHGGDKQEAQDQNPMQLSNIGNLNQRDLKTKVQKPCAYFNTPRGCRHGAGCLFLHDASSVPQRIEQPTETAKRIKLDGGIAGRN